MISPVRNTLQDKLLQYYTQKLMQHAYIRKQKNKHVECRAVGLLYTHEATKPEKTDAVLRAVEKINSNDKQVQVLCYLPSQPADPNTPFPTFTKNDINLLGKTKHKQLNQFFQTHFDHLYHLDLVSEPVLDYIVAKAYANCKIGNFINGRENLFEISFKGLVEAEEENAFDNMINKMFTYIQLLKV